MAAASPAVLLEEDAATVAHLAADTSLVAVEELLAVVVLPRKHEHDGPYIFELSPLPSYRDFAVPDTPLTIHGYRDVYCTRPFRACIKSHSTAREKWASAVVLHSSPLHSEWFRS